MGQRPKRTEKLVASMLEWIENGETLTDWAKAHGLALRTPHLWREKDPELQRRYDAARLVGFEVLAERALREARVVREGVVSTTETYEREDGSTGVKEKVVTSDNVARSKLIVDTTLKLLAKWTPKLYGDKLQLGGAEGLPALGSNSMSDDERVKRIELILASARERKAKAVEEVDDDTD